MNRSEIPHWPTESSTGWCTTRIASRCVGTPCVKRKERRRKSECIGGPKAVEKTGERRPWKSQERFPLSHSFNNNKLDDRDHFQQNAKTSVASLRGLIGSSRNTDRHHSGMLIDFIGIPSKVGIGNLFPRGGNLRKLLRFFLIAPLSGIWANRVVSENAYISGSKWPPVGISNL